MGTYYRVACGDFKERLDPGAINDCGVEAGSIDHPRHPLGPVTIHALLYRWNGHCCRVVSDSGPDDEAYDGYADVTAAVLDSYNEAHTRNGPPLRHTPSDDPEV